MGYSFFFSISGFLLGEKYFNSKKPIRLLSAIKTQFLRLSMPYYLTIIGVIFSMLVSIYFELPLNYLPPPTAKDFFYNVLMIQDLLGVPALSAGFWYVSIHLQLVTVSLLIFKIADYFSIKTKPWLTGIVFFSLWAMSAFYFNRNELYYIMFIYYFGSFGLGLLASWCLRKAPIIWFLIVGLCFLALDEEFRIRLFLSLILSSLILAYAYCQWTFCSKLSSYLNQLAQQTLSIFLFHYPVIVIVNGLFQKYCHLNPIFRTNVEDFYN